MIKQEVCSHITSENREGRSTIDLARQGIEGCLSGFCLKKQK
jgi:hypothetical protein